MLTPRGITKAQGASLLKRFGNGDVPLPSPSRESPTTVTPNALPFHQDEFGSFDAQQAPVYKAIRDAEADYQALTQTDPNLGRTLKALAGNGDPKAHLRMLHANKNTNPAFQANIVEEYLLKLAQKFRTLNGDFS